MNPTWNAVLNSDGTVTVYLTIGNRTESMTLTPEEDTFTPPTLKKGRRTVKSEVSSVKVESSKYVPKSKQKYPGPNGKMVSYARARQLGLV